MEIRNTNMLIEFGRRHADAKSQVESWLKNVRLASWKTPADVLHTYGNARFVKGRRAIFNICGNKYRLIVLFDFACDRVSIRFVGTHREYNRVKAETV